MSSHHSAFRDRKELPVSIHIDSKGHRSERQQALPVQMLAARPSGGTFASGLSQAAIVQLLERAPGATSTPFSGEGGASLIQQAAQRGIVGQSQPLPYLKTIQRAFGDHDVSNIQSHTGSEASESARAIGAEAFAMGRHVVFGEKPSLRTAAHEAAHVIQQRAGVHLKGGVGKVGDVYERHADEVADRVVQGRSAADLLDRFMPTNRVEMTSSLQPLAIQRKTVVPEITDEEEDAVRKYKGDDYQYFNFYLRGQQLKTAKVKGIVPYVNLLSSALTKMHNSGNYRYRGNLYRGDHFASYPESDHEHMDTKGDTIRILSFFSTTKEKGVAERYGTDLWKISSNMNGVDIHAAGLGQKSEAEVLFPPNSEFHITKERRKVGTPKPFGIRKRKITGYQTA